MTAFRKTVSTLALALPLMAGTGCSTALTATDAHSDEETTMQKQIVRYEDFGATGDGKTDDLAAIVAAHAHANAHGLPVRADDDATYYIGGTAKTAIIETDTDFGSAAFIIDDTKLENIKTRVFDVRSTLKTIALDGVQTLKRDQPRLDLALPYACVVVATDTNTKRYIRKGLNPNSGSSQTDAFLVGKDGTIDPNTPILWDFDQITKLEAHPVDDTTLSVRGGRFTTIANQAEAKYTYHARGIVIRRSNVVVDGVEHRITGEGKSGAPYHGFISVGSCANVLIQNTQLSGHKTYRTIGRANKPVSMGSYDLTANRALNVTFRNVTQINNIKDGSRWGIMASNFSKNLRYENCTLSRFDAHQGVFNATIKDSVIGHAGINLIGRGTFLIENSTVHSGRFVSLRSDYGSTWEGEFIIRNCTFVPKGGRTALIVGSNAGTHDFGYPCYMPERITIDGLQIDDADHTGDYKGPALFGDFNRKFNERYTETYPYQKTREVILKNVTTASGKALRLSDNPAMFKDVTMTRVDSD